MDATNQPDIRIHQIFLGRALFEYTSHPVALPPNTPIVEANSRVQVSVSMDEEEKAGFVSVTVATAPDSKSPYRFEVEMIGIMERGEEAVTDLRDYLIRAGPPTIYPYLREAVSNLTGRGRFGPVWLGPMNFTAICEQLLAELSTEKKE